MRYVQLYSSWSQLLCYVPNSLQTSRRFFHVSIFFIQLEPSDIVDCRQKIEQYLSNAEPCHAVAFCGFIDEKKETKVV